MIRDSDTTTIRAVAAAAVTVAVPPTLAGRPSPGWPPAGIRDQRRPLVACRAGARACKRRLGDSELRLRRRCAASGRWQTGFQLGPAARPGWMGPPAGPGHWHASGLRRRPGRVRPSHSDSRLARALRALGRRGHGEGSESTRPARRQRLGYGPGDRDRPRRRRTRPLMGCCRHKPMIRDGPETGKIEEARAPPASRHTEHTVCGPPGPDLRPGQLLRA
jgi:hypothetical protein